MAVHVVQYVLGDHGKQYWEHHDIHQTTSRPANNAADQLPEPPSEIIA